MQNTKIVEIETLGGLQEHIVITNDDGSEVAMLKSTWDELQAKQTEGGLI